MMQVDPRNSSKVQFHSAESQPNDISSDQASPAEQYQKKLEAIKNACKIAGIDKSTLYAEKQEVKKEKIIFKIEGDKIIPVVVATTVGGKTIHEIGKHLIQSPPPSYSFRGISMDEAPPRLGQNKNVLIGIGTLVVGIGIAFATAKYHLLAQEIRQEILQAFQNIPKDNIDQKKLLEMVDAIISKKDQSWFSGIFERCNPIPMGYLLLTKGIALDSESHFEVAQKYYERALQYSLDNYLQDILRFAYARSLRLSKNNNEIILGQIDKIEESSPLYHLGQVEKRCIKQAEKEVFDEENTPYIFKCPITEDIMENPTYYVINDHKFYHEHEAIKSWIEKKGTCPITNQPLEVNDLIPDQSLAPTIQLWNQIKLKKL